MYKDETITIPPKGEFCWVVHENGGKVIELKLSPKGFFYNGERIDDIHKIYERYHEWMTEIEKRKIE